MTLFRNINNKETFNNFQLKIFKITLQLLPITDSFKN